MSYLGFSFILNAFIPSCHIDIRLQYMLNIGTYFAFLYANQSLKDNEFTGYFESQKGC